MFQFQACEYDQVFFMNDSANNALLPLLAPIKNLDKISLLPYARGTVSVLVGHFTVAGAAQPHNGYPAFQPPPTRFTAPLREPSPSESEGMTSAELRESTNGFTEPADVLPATATSTAKTSASTVPSAWNRADRLKRYESLKNPLGRAGFLFPLRQGMSGAAGALQGFR